MNGMGESFHSEDFEDFQPSSQSSQPQQLLLQHQQQVKVTSQQQQQQPTPFYSSTNSNAGSGVGQQNVTGANSGSCSPVAGSNNSRPQICCLVDDGNRCHRPAGNASYSKRIQKTVYFKRLRLEIDLMAHHTYICDYHKMIIQNARTRQKRESEDETNENEANDDVPEVDLYQLQVNTLRRYKKYFKIPSRPGLNKAQLADILMRHFKTIPVNEKETVTYFIYMIKQERNKLDNKEARQEGMMGGSAEFLDRY